MLCFARSQHPIVKQVPTYFPHLAFLQIRKGADQEWRDLIIPNSVRAIVMINLQTYMGGCDLWGMHEHHMPEEQAKNLKKPIFDDGLIEVTPAMHLMPPYGKVQDWAICSNHLNGQSASATLI